MKKIKFIFICLFIVTLSTVILFVPKNCVSAEQIETNKEYSIFLNGYGQYEVKADNVKISFAVLAIDESSLNAMQTVNTKMQDIQNALSEEFSSIETNNCIEFMHTNFKINNIKYEYTKICTINIDNIEQIDKITSIINDNNAKIIDIKYSVKDIKQAYSNAFNNAIEDAKQTAMNINANLKVHQVIEKNIIYSTYLLNNNSENIIINAKVVVNFKCDKEDNYIPDNIDEDGLYILETPANRKQVIPI